MKRSGLLAKVTFSLVMIGGSLVSSGTPAKADPMSGVEYTVWEHFAHAVGNCGERSGHWVRVVQAFTWANSNLSQGGVDGYWGPNSINALKAWQSAHALSADGCAGFNSWNRFGDSVHMTFVGAFNGGYYQRFRYQEPGKSQYMTMDASPYTWWFQWFDGWHPIDQGFSNSAPIYNYEYSPPRLEGYETHS